MIEAGIVASNVSAKLTFLKFLPESVLPSDSKSDEKPGALTPQQKFFISYGQSWCANQTPQMLRLMAQSDPHSTPQYRVNGVLSNMPEFQKAFACKRGQPMVRGNACRVW